MGHVGENLVEDNIMVVRFEDLNKYLPVELARYIKNHMVEASMIKGPFNNWVFNVLKGHTIVIRFLYRVRYIGRGCRL